MYTHHINPILFQGFGLQIRYYGLFFAILFSLSYALGQWYLKMHKKSLAKIDSMFMACFLGVLIGARLGHVFFYEWPYYSEHLVEILYIWRGGLASHGAVIGLAASIFYMRYLTKLPFYFLSDIVALCGSLAVFFVRMGNFINGEIVGRVTNVPWAVIFPCNEYQLNQCGPEPRHPPQLYEGLLGILLFLLLFLLVKKYKTKLPQGLLTGLFLIIYFGGRFVLEFFKEYTGTVFLYPLTNGQVLSVPLVVIGVILLVKTLFVSSRAKPAHI